MPAGRPTRYSLDMCDKVIEIGKEGGSMVAMAVGLGITRQTMYTWMQMHPEFLDSVTRAREEAQVWWEQQGKIGLFADKFNAMVWKKTVEARFPDDYRSSDRLDIGAAGESMTEEDRLRRINEILSKAAKRASGDD